MSVYGCQRELEPGNKGIAIVGAVTRQLLTKTLRAGKYFPCVIVACEVQSRVVSV
jgi:hypothetical protein